MDKCTHDIWNKQKNADGSIDFECMFCREKPVHIDAEEAQKMSQAAIEKRLTDYIKELRK